MSRVASLLAVLALLALTAAPAGSARAAEDLHRLFEERCGRCHGHAGDFARQSLVLEDGVVKGRKTGKDVRAFLPGHFGKLSAEQIALLRDTFALQIESGGLFQQKCRTCHEPANELARLKLTLRDGRLVGRYTGADMRDFLARHGRATPEEAELLYRVLLWQLRIIDP